MAKYKASRKYSTAEVISRIFKVAKKYIIYLAIGMAAMLISGLFAVWPSLAIKLITDALASGDFLHKAIDIDIIPKQLLQYGFEPHKIRIDLKELVNYTPWVMLFFFLLEGLFKFLYLFCTNYFSLLIGKDFERQLYKKAISLDMKKIKARSSGDFSSCIVNDVKAIQSSLADILICVIKDSIYIAVFTITLTCINWRLSIFCILILPIFFAATYYMLRRLKKMAAGGQDFLGQTVTFVSESIQGMEIIHLNNAYNKFTSKFNLLLVKLEDLAKKAIMINAAVSPLLGLLGAAIIGFVAIWIGFKEVSEGRMTVGDFSAYVVMTVLLYQPARRVLQVMGKISRLLGGSYRILELLDTPSEASGTKTSLPIILDKESFIEFKNLEFHYNKKIKVLKNINLSIKQGEKVAFVGPSGAGKSTIIKLIPKFFDPVEGDISVEGISIFDWDLKELRDKISFVHQDTMLFTGSLKENLLIAKPSATDEEINKALEMAKVDFLHLIKNGINAEMSERGNNLSGGQRQRIGLARAFLKNSPILILDEPTSSLDMQSEELIQKSIVELIQNRTVIMVTHKLSLIKDFDKIVCFKHGEIIESGTHQELLANNNYYAELLKSELS